MGSDPEICPLDNRSNKAFPDDFFNLGRFRPVFKLIKVNCKILLLL